MSACRSTLPARCWSRATRRLTTASDRGAIAVLYAVVVVLLIVPLIGVGTSTYIATGTAGELQRGSDSGALYGAGEIPLGDDTFALNYLSAAAAPVTAPVLAAANTPVTNPVNGTPIAGAPAGVASDAVSAALAALNARLLAAQQTVAAAAATASGTVNTAAGTSLVIPGETPVLLPGLALDQVVGATQTAVTSTPVTPLADASAQCRNELAAHADLGTSYALPYGGSQCTASYLADNPLLSHLTSCLANLTAPGTTNVAAAETTLQQALSGTALGSLQPTLAGYVQGVVGQLELLQGGLADTLPALLRPGVAVAAGWNEKGPFANLIGQGPTAQAKAAYARRAFKNLVVLPVVDQSVNAAVSLSDTATVSAFGTDLSASVQAATGAATSVKLNPNPTAAAAIAAVRTTVAGEIATLTALPSTVSSAVTAGVTAALTASSAATGAAGSLLGGTPLAPVAPVSQAVATAAAGMVNQAVADQVAALQQAVAPCVQALSDSNSDVTGLLSPPPTGPDALGIAQDAIAHGESITVVRVASELGVPFLDVAQVCFAGTAVPTSVTDLTSAASALHPGVCTAQAPGAFRSVLVSS